MTAEEMRERALDLEEHAWHEPDPRVAEALRARAAELRELADTPPAQRRAIHYPG